MSKTTMSSTCGRLHSLFKSPLPINTTAAAASTKTATRGKPTKSQNSNTKGKITSKQVGELKNTDATPKTTTSSQEAGKSENTETNPKTKKPGAFQKMVKRFQKCSESSEFRNRHDIYLNTVRRLAANKRFSMIREILDHQKNFEDIKNESFLSRLISLYGKAGMFDEARKLFDEMSDLYCPRTVMSFNALLSAGIDAGRFDDVKGIVRDLGRELGITLDVVSCNVAIKGFVKMGDLDSAGLLFDEMVKKGVEPSLVTFNTLLNGFYGNGRFADGERVWDRMLEMNLGPDGRTYYMKLRGLALQKRMEDAVALFEEMKSKGIKPNHFCFNALIIGFISSKNLEETRQWYDEMRRNDNEPDRMTFQTLIPFLCKMGDLSFAFSVCEEGLSKKWPVDKKLVQLVMDELMKESKIQLAEKLVQLGKKKKYDLTLP